MQHGWRAGIGLAVILIGAFGLGIAPPRPVAQRAFAAGPAVYVPLVLRRFERPFLDAPTAPATATPSITPAPSDTPTPTDTPPPTDTPTRTPTPTITPSPTPKLPAWQARVNFHRALARLGPVTENSAWSRGGELHARYVVKEQAPGHGESRSSRWFTQEGLDAAQNGNVFASTVFDAPSEDSVDTWMVGPFHQTAILDPRLQTSGYGEYRENLGFPKISFAATLDVLRGRTGVAPGTRFPLRYPDDGMVMPALAYTGGESPDPLTSCPGYAPADPRETRTGPPIVLILGGGDVTPKVSRTAFADAGGQALPHCWFDQTTYKNTNSAAQSTGRGGLAMRSAVIVMPKAPLAANSRYTVTVVNSGTTHTWSFRTASGYGVDAHSH